LGRIGRLVLRNAARRILEPDNPAVVRSGVDLEVVAANDLASADELVYLLNHDSVHDVRHPRAERTEEGIALGPLQVKLSSEKEPSRIPWGENGVDVVIECTGRFTKRAGMEGHLSGGGPSRVIQGAPGEVDRTVVVGINEDDVTDADRLLSNASCTTNALAPVLDVLDRAFGIRWGILGTVHAYTAGQGLVDGLSRKDFRRGRAAAVNIVPTSTGAGRAVSLVLPGLAGKLEASAVRVPVPDGSLFEVTCTLDDTIALDRALEALRDAAASRRLQGILDVRDDALVSSDIVGDSHSSIVDVGACLARGPLLKIVGWYDNEAGYAARVLDLASHVGA
jgi:glyceraldehyde 3-phosphate dehydrogenase